MPKRHAYRYSFTFLPRRVDEARHAFPAEVRGRLDALAGVQGWTLFDACQAWQANGIREESRGHRLDVDLVAANEGAADRLERDLYTLVVELKELDGAGEVLVTRWPVGAERL